MLPAATPLPCDTEVDLAIVSADPTQVLTSWLSDVVDGNDLVPRLLRLADGRLLPLPVARWAAPADAVDETVLSRATGSVLDVGCGPGRLTAALHARGVDVLGLELVADIPVLARAAGAPLVLGDVFGPVPRAGQWQTVLLADGNIGIGGDPVRMLRRVRGLLAPAGRTLVELHPEPAPPVGPVRLETLGTTSAWFSWALVGTAGLPAAASAAGLRVDETWSAGGRQFTALVPA